MDTNLVQGLESLTSPPITKESKVIKAIILCVLIIVSQAIFATQNITIKYYTAPWCAWCVKQAPIIDKIEKDKGINVVRIQSEDRVVPQIEIIINGKVVKTFLGFTPYIAIVPYL